MASSSSYTKYEILRRDPNPRSAALLVIDMQNYFSSIATPILPNLLTTVDLCRDAGIPVIYIRHCHRLSSDGPMLAERWNGHLIFDGTPESEFLPSIGRVPDRDLVVEKSTYSAFAGGTNLEEMLRKMGVEEVIVTGVMTNVCCETTTRDAFDRGFRVFFSVDATGTAHKELHDATIKNLAYAFAYLVDCKRLKEGFSRLKV